MQSQSVLQATQATTQGAKFGGGGADLPTSFTVPRTGGAVVMLTQVTTG